jgi:hypothetical protein
VFGAKGCSDLQHQGFVTKVVLLGVIGQRHERRHTCTYLQQYSTAFVKDWYACEDETKHMMYARYMHANSFLSAPSADADAAFK